VWGQKDNGKARQNNKENEQQALAVNSPVNKKKKQDDWNYLKQTLRSNKGLGAGQEEEQLEQNLLTFHEKADELVEEAEELRSKHLEYLKESA
jgi:hypothetical protein